MSKKVLVVEDNHDDRILMSHIIEQLTHHHVEAVRDGIDALLMAQGHQFDLIVLDLHLPSVQGWDIVQTLRQTARYSTTPIIALTAYNHTFARAATVSAGCNAYLTKPVDIDRLVEEVNHLLPG